MAEWTEFDEIMMQMAKRGYCLVLFMGQMYEAAFVKWAETNEIPKDCYKSLDLLSTVRGAADHTGELIPGHAEQEGPDSPEGPTGKEEDESRCS